LSDDGRQDELERIGFRPFFAAQLAKLEPGLVPARIAIAHGESYVAWTATGVSKALIVGRKLAAWQTAADRPQVGDWVAGVHSAELGALLIEHRLERQTCLSRQAAAERPERQIIAANVDVVGIVNALGDGNDPERDLRIINESRLRRYLGAVAQSGARPLLIVNKSDLSPDPAAVAAALAGSFPDVPVVTLSGQQGVGLERLEPWLGRGQSLVLVGMSGVGKSTLVNTLMGGTAQRVGAVRASDARGRHTTTHRELVVLPNGALLIDTPGMREMALWNEEDAGAAASPADRRGRWRQRHRRR
jgi:ribosome biogenesis GTPase / thiamine phosphate phosphatase